KITFEDAPAQFLVHEIKQFDGACMHRDRPRLTARTRHAFDASIFDAAARQFHRQYAPNRTATDDQYGDFTDVRHTGLGTTVGAVYDRLGGHRPPLQLCLCVLSSWLKQN